MTEQNTINPEAAAETAQPVCPAPAEPWYKRIPLKKIGVFVGAAAVVGVGGYLAYNGMLEKAAEVAADVATDVATKALETAATTAEVVVETVG